jgi:hypothetical protein
MRGDHDPAVSGANRPIKRVFRQLRHAIRTRVGAEAAPMRALGNEKTVREATETIDESTSLLS